MVYLQNLGTPNITLYDEAIHANVIKNLAEHGSPPKLHRSPAKTDFRDWTNNTVWLHKPLVPFYVTAVSYRFLGGSLWALRLPGAAFALLTAFVVYLIGHRFMNDHTGICGAAIFGLCPFTNDLVHGRTFSGFPDLLFVFFLSVALYLIMDWTQTRLPATLRWIGSVLALAYMCKGGLVFAPFVVLAVLTILTGGFRALIPLRQPALIFAVMVLPEKLYWLVHYPVEFRYEQQQQLMHLFKSIENHGHSWDFYFTSHIPYMLRRPVAPFAYFSIAWTLIRSRPGEPGFALNLWALAYLVPLSFGASKIHNFIFPILPAIALLIPHAVEELMRSHRFSMVFSLCVSSFAVYLLSWAVGDNPISRWVPLLAAGTVLVATLLLQMQIGFASRTAARSVLAATVSVLLLFYLRKDFHENNQEPADRAAQAILRESSFALRPLLNEDSVVLLRSSAMPNYAYLYIMYWSGLDCFSLCPESPPPERAARLLVRNNAYLLADELLPTAPVARLPGGYLYPLKDVPFGSSSAVSCGTF